MLHALDKAKLVDFVFIGRKCRVYRYVHKTRNIGEKDLTKSQNKKKLFVPIISTALSAKSSFLKIK